MDTIVAEWARERPELDLVEVAAVGRILRAARFLRAEVERELQRFGLNATEFNALSALRRSGPPYRLSPSELSAGLLLSSGGLTKVLERLESEGLITRERDPHDGRGVLVCLTDAGRQRQNQAYDAHLQNEHELLAPLAVAEREALSDILRSLLLAFESGAGRARPIVRVRSEHAPL
jgi:DNA-binding MarR family transcriptional regulator